MYVEAAGIEDAGEAPKGREKPLAAGNLREAADASGRGRTRAVARLATAGAEAAEAELVALGAAAIEATAAKAPWRDMVRLARGFAEEAGRFLLSRLSSHDEEAAGLQDRAGARTSRDSARRR